MSTTQYDVTKSHYSEQLVKMQLLERYKRIQGTGAYVRKLNFKKFPANQRFIKSNETKQKRWVRLIIKN